MLISSDYSKRVTHGTCCDRGYGFVSFNCEPHQCCLLITMLISFSLIHITSVSLLMLKNLIMADIFLLALSFLMPKLYSNTVLSSLNARRRLRPLAQGISHSDTESGTRVSVLPCHTIFNQNNSLTFFAQPADIVALSHNSVRPQVRCLLISMSLHC